MCALTTDALASSVTLKKILTVSSIAKEYSAKATTIVRLAFPIQDAMGTVPVTVIIILAT